MESRNNILLLLLLMNFGVVAATMEGIFGDDYGAFQA
jgi:hypothetical protein